MMKIFFIERKTSIKLNVNIASAISYKYLLNNKQNILFHYQSFELTYMHQMQV